MSRDVSSLIRPGCGMKILDTVSEFDYDFWNGRLLVWEAPISGEEYCLGVDPAEGVGQDRSVCQVIKKGNLQHPDVQVAEFCSDWMDPIYFADAVNVIGRFYGDADGSEAFATIECNAPCGDVMINDLRARLNYTNLFIWKAYDRITNMYTNKYGWWTNRVTRPKIIARGMHAMLQGDLIINSEYCLDEMADFERDHFIAKAKARHGRHDDRIMSLLIAYWGAHDSEWLAGEDLAEERRLQTNAQEVQEEIVVASGAPKPNFQNQALSYAKMMERWEEQFYDGLE